MTDLILPPGINTPLQQELDDIDLKKTVDYGEGVDRLEDWYFNAFYSFSVYLGRNIPPKFEKNSAQATDKYSCSKGLVAYKQAMNIMKQVVRGEKVNLMDHRLTIEDDGLMATLNINGLIPFEPYDKLSDWYRDNIIEFVRQSFEIIPPKFKVDEGSESHYPSCAIEGIKQCMTELERYLN